MVIKNKIKSLLNSKFLKKAGKDTAYYSLAQVGSKLITILALPFLARTLSSQDFSYYDIFLILSNFLVILVTLGADSGLVVGLIDQHKRGRAGKMLSIAIMIICSAWLLICCCLILLFPLYREHLSLFYLVTALLYALLMSLQTLFSAFLRWTDKAKEAAVVTFVSNVLGVVVGLIVAYFNKADFLQYFIGGLLLGSFISFVVGILFVKKHVSRISYKKDYLFIKEFFQYSIPYVTGSLVNNVVSNVDRLIIYPLFAADIYATYAFCSRVMQIPRVALSIIGTGIQPSLLNDYTSEAGKRRVKNTYEYFTLSYIIIVIITIIFSGPIVLLFGGSKFGDANTMLPVMVATGLFASSIYFNGWGYIISKRVSDLAIILFVFAIINFVANYLMAKNFGIMEMLFVSMILNAFLSFFYTFRSERLYSFNYSFKLISIAFGIIVTLILLQLYFN